MAEPTPCKGCEGLSEYDDGGYCFPCRCDVESGLRDETTGDLNPTGERHYAEPETEADWLDQQAWDVECASCDWSGVFGDLDDNHCPSCGINLTT